LSFPAKSWTLRGKCRENVFDTEIATMLLTALAFFALFQRNKK
jgi:hypothetical protein